jgi:NhaP-type Na+/H+ or K+/H+ antiporter
MISEPLIVIAVCLVAYAIFSERLSNSVVSAPMIFMFAGLAAGPAGFGFFDVSIDSHILEAFGELTLGFILFADAAATNSRQLASDYKLPRRLLLIGLPLTMVFGAGVAVLMFPDLSWMEAALIAAILAPTDAALGYAVVTSEAVPARIRQAILVESGVNDGLALPAVLLFAALAFSAETGGAEGPGYWIGFTVKQIVIGAAVGAVLGGVLGKLIHDADGRGWIAHSFRNLSCVGVAILTLLGAHLVDGNGFIAAFIGGLVFGSFCKKRAGALTGFVEEEGQLFSLVIFFIFGAVLLPAATDYFTVFCFFYAILSLTIIRMAPTALSLVGSGVKPPTMAFIGWFGPRGLASILFLFIAVEHQEMEALSQIQAIVYITVALSVIAHGVTAAPLSRAYGATASAKADAATG